MDRRTQKIEKVDARDLTVDGRLGENSRDGEEAQSGPTLELGKAFVKTVRHFWPELSLWLGRLPDTRFEPMVIYDRKFLAWWGIILFALKLGSRRQLDFDLRDETTKVLGNINNLAGTNQETLPVHNTLEHFLGHVGWEAFAHLDVMMIRRLIRMRMLDNDRLEGCYVVAADGTGVLAFNRRHCDHCLTQKHGDRTYYFHTVLEAKLLTEYGLALSMGSEFIENPENVQAADDSQDYEQIKQDCELKAFDRLAEQIRKNYPRMPILITSDSLFGCGRAIQLCKEYGLSYVFTFKPGRTPAAWEEFLALAKASPQNTLKKELPDDTVQVYRWVNDFRYEDSEGRIHTFDAFMCEETSPNGETTTFAWMTDRRVTEKNVVRLSMKGGRARSKIENEGFNVQKNSGLNLEHAYSFDKRNWKAFYFLLQIAHIILQLLEKGNLLRGTAEQLGKKTAVALFGSLKNIARRLLECFRYFAIPEEAFDTSLAGHIQIRIRFDST